MMPSESVRSHLRQVNIVSFAILIGTLVFAGVVWYLLRSGGLPREGMDLPTSPHPEGESPLNPSAGSGT